MTLSAIAINCSLKGTSGEDSSTDKMIGLLVSELKKHGVGFRETIRIADYDVKPGVTSDEGDGDEWPDIRAKVMNAHILVIATPIWMGQPASVCKMVLERLDAELSETDAEGRLSTFGKVAAVAVVGNEDGAHHVTAEVLQALNDVGFTAAANASTYWVGEAMGKVDYQDAGPKPDTTGTATRTLAANTAHLAHLLAERPYPPA